jgi:TetR/AcrR family transcriptional regulator, regulator of cefoperazone and chloramphenicol sensitivity
MFYKTDPAKFDDTGSSETKRRILEASGRSFAESGFRNATVREICKRAGVNVAAINYHFGDKKSLYLATLQCWQKAAFEKYPLDRAADSSIPLSERLNIFVTQFLRRVFDEGEASWFGKLIVRELVEPTEGLDVMVEEAARPTFQILSGIIRELLGSGASEAAVRLSAASVVGQSIFFFVQRPIIERLFAGEEKVGSQVEIIAAHVTRFSLDAILASAGTKKGEAP